MFFLRGIPLYSFPQKHQCVLLLDRFSRSAVPALLHVGILVLCALLFVGKGVAVPLGSLLMRELADVWILSSVNNSLAVTAHTVNIVELTSMHGRTFVYVGTS